MVTAIGVERMCYKTCSDTDYVGCGRHNCEQYIMFLFRKGWKTKNLIRKYVSLGLLSEESALNMTHTKESGKSTIIGLEHDPWGRRTLTLSESKQQQFVERRRESILIVKDGDRSKPVKLIEYYTTIRYD